MEKLLTYIMLFKIIFKIYICKIYYYFLLVKIENGIQIKLNNFI